MDKILIVNNFYSRSGGAHVAALNQYELLKKNNINVYFFCASSDLNHDENVFVVYKNRFIRLFVKLFCLGFIFDIYVLVRFFMTLKKIQPTIVHVHLFKASLSNSILYALSLSKNVQKILTHHDFSIIDSNSLLVDNDNKIMKSVLSGNVFDNVIKRTTKNSYILSFLIFIDWKTAHLIGYKTIFHKHITVSNFSKKLIRSSPFGVDSNVLYNFTNKIKFDKLNIEYDYCFIGRFIDEKGVKTLLNAIKSNKDEIFLFVGFGPLLYLINEEAKYNKNIHIKFAQNDNEVKMLLKKSRWLIIPSITFENNPLVILESWSVGTPVFGSNHGGIKELLEIGGTLKYGFKAGKTTSLNSSLQQTKNISLSNYKNLSIKAQNCFNDFFSDSIHFNNLMKIYNET
jgi:glycosyltransferase involved in cell wall biosynthesis